jgi:hypothetical protein
MSWLRDSVREFPTKEAAEKAWLGPLRWTLQPARWKRCGVFGMVRLNPKRWLGQTDGLGLTVATVVVS